MAKRLRMRLLQRFVDDSGFGDEYNGRFINKKGLPNVRKKGVNYFERISLFHHLLNMSNWAFFSYMTGSYIFINTIFGFVYYLIGVEQLEGIEPGTFFHEISNTFFFSTQTFTTLGYGKISPVGFWANSVASLEAYIGLIMFAMATGLFFGRISRPRAYLRFSDKAIVSPYQDKKALMFRMAPYKDNALTDAEVFASVAIETEVDGEDKILFYSLDIELNKISTLALNWTVVHIMDKDSPFYKFDSEDFKDRFIEVMVHVKAFDEVFSNTVVQRHSYVSDEIVYGAKYVKMYENTDDNSGTLLYLNKINAIEPYSFKKKK